jgi:hypothetical protein
MPPRYAYWTILIDNSPTAFRAREREDLLPTLAQLRRTNSNVLLKWFARGRLWDSPEAEREAQRRPLAGKEKRGRDWRPGGAHADPRDHLKKGRDGQRPKFGSPGESRPWQSTSNPPSSDRPRGDRPWTKSGRPPSDAPRRERPWGGKPQGKATSWRDKRGGSRHGERSWHNKPRDGRPFVRRDQRPPHKRRDDDPDKK